METQAALGNKEKALVALSAAMGSGCRTCARRLQPMAKAAGAGEEEIEQALRLGVEMRQFATTTVRREVEALLGRETLRESRPLAPEERRRAALSRLAAAVAANSAPDARQHLEVARANGASEASIRLAMSLARQVRSKAQSFSDEEIEAYRQHSVPPPSAGADPGEAAPGSTAGCCGGENGARAASRD